MVAVAIRRHDLCILFQLCALHLATNEFFLTCIIGL